MQISVIEGDFLPQIARYGVLVARFNGFIVDSLQAGALDALQRHGITDEQIQIVKVPGAYELPLAAQAMASTGKYEAIIALGAVIRGSTPHFDYVAGEAAKGLGSVAMNHKLPVIFGVLTTDSIEQAIERAGTKAGNKGYEAALTALEMVSLLRKLRS